MHEFIWRSGNMEKCYSCPEFEKYSCWWRGSKGGGGVSFSKSPLLFNIIKPFLFNKLKTFCNTVHLNFTYKFWCILKIKKKVKYQLVGNRIGGVLASMLSPSEVDWRFKPWQGHFQKNVKLIFAASPRTT